MAELLGASAQRDYDKEPEWERPEWQQYLNTGTVAVPAKAGVVNYSAATLGNG